MKRLRFSILLLFVISAISSCKKVPVLDWASANISFKVDGTAKAAKGDKNVFALYLKEENIVQVIGNLDAAGDQQIGLTIGNFHGVGEYTTEADFLATYNTPEINETVVGIEGKIKITEFIEGKSIKGEFQFKGQPFSISTDPNSPVPADMIFSEGKFEAKVSAYSGPVLSPVSTRKPAGPDGMRLN